MAQPIPAQSGRPLVYLDFDLDEVKVLEGAVQLFIDLGPSLILAAAHPLLPKIASMDNLLQALRLTLCEARQELERPA